MQLQLAWKLRLPSSDVVVTVEDVDVALRLLVEVVLTLLVLEA